MNLYQLKKKFKPGVKVKANYIARIDAHNIPMEVVGIEDDVFIKTKFLTEYRGSVTEEFTLFHYTRLEIIDESLES